MSEIFNRVKQLVTTREAAEYYGLKVSRSGMTRCVFHDDHTPSMKVDGRFYCFGCHMTGDVIDLVARMFHLSLFQAAKKLERDFGGRPDPEEEQDDGLPPIVSLRDAYEENGLKIMTRYERRLKAVQAQYAPSAPDGQWDSRFVEATNALPPVLSTIDGLLSADPKERQAAMAYIEENSLDKKVRAILERCEAKRKEKEHAGEDHAA